MAQPLCIYCQERPGTTRDHVFPLAWYPTTTPSTIQRRTVPCCPACNKRLQRAEEETGLDWLFCCNPSLPEIAGVWDNVVRGWNAQHSRAFEDPSHRKAKHQKFMRKIEWVEPDPGSPVMWAKKDGVYRRASARRSLNQLTPSIVVEKFIRGVHYHEVKWIQAMRAQQKLPPLGAPPAYGNPLLPVPLLVKGGITPNQYVRFADPPPNLNLKLDSGLIEAMKRRPWYGMFGPGFRYRSLFRRLDEPSMWEFQLWGQLDIYAFAYPRESLLPHAQYGP